MAWPDMDRGYALAWHANKAATCPGCGTRADEWAEDSNAYISEHTFCQGCARRAEENNNVPRDDSGQPLPGHHVFLQPRATFEHLNPDVEITD